MLEGKKKCWAVVETEEFLNSRSSLAPKSPHHTIRTVNPSCRTKNFLASLASCSSNPAILSLVEPYSIKYIPKAADGSLPQCLTAHKHEYLKNNYLELLAIDEEIVIEVNKDEVDKAKILHDPNCWVARSS